VAPRYEFELAPAMTEAGYYTFAIGKLHFYPQRNHHGFHGALIDESGRVQSPGFINDYRQWFKLQAPDLDPDATGIGFNDYRSRPYVLPEELHPTRWTADMAVDFLNRYDRSEPLFLKVSFARPHSPYDPPRRFLEMYEEGAMPPPYVGDWAERNAPIGDPNDYVRWRGDMGPAQVRTSRRGYYGSVSFIDEQVGFILKALEKRAMLDNTLILFTADHGDMLGDHNLWRKTYAYEGSAKVPMLIRWPKSMGMEDRRGTTASQPVELRDVLPTFLDVAGAPPKVKLDGASLLDIVRGKADKWREYLDLEHTICYGPENHWNALTDGRVKYVYHAMSGEEQLFDLAADPGELRDLASESAHEATLKLWRARMVAHLAGRGDAWVKNGRLQPRPRSMPFSPHYPKPT